MTDVLDVAVVGVFVDEVSEAAVVLLAEPDGDRVLPIVIGHAAARSILVGLAAIDTPRPLAHDLLLHVLEAVDARVVRVDVVGVDDGTYFGELEVADGDHAVRLDARPSDCIGVAVRAGVPIGVARSVFDRASVEIDDPGVEGGTERVEQLVRDFREFLDSVEAADFD